MNKHKNKYFGTDGIRGMVGDEVMNQKFAYRLGQALVEFCRTHNLEEKIIIGHDTRWSALELQAAIVLGIKDSGGEYLLVGNIPTPGMVFLSREEKVGLGVQITASHNDYRYNGFKVITGEGEKMSLEAEGELEALIDKANVLRKDLVVSSYEEVNTIYVKKYYDFLKNIFASDNFKDFKVVLDCAQGASYKIAPELFTELVGSVSSLFNYPNGKNINENCGSQYPEELAREVKRQGASIGLAFDGDGDRIIIVDELGNILTGDHILFILAKMLQLQGQLKNDIVVSTVMSNLGFVQALEKEGIRYSQSDVGDSVVCREMRRVDAILGGEEAGHIILLEFLPGGDGLLVGLLLLRALKFFGQPLSELAKSFESYPKVLKNIEVREKPELETLSELQDLIQKLETDMGDKGRILVRYSGTEPKCRVMVEHQEAKLAEKYVDKIVRKIDEIINKN
jgi:phosphoglucosamine mutase